MLKIIPGFEPYAADDLGNIWNTNLGIKMALFPTSAGYLGLNLRVTNKKRRFGLVHRLVASAFYGFHEDLHVRHLDNDKLNNKPDNLQWGTRKENMADKKENGTWPNGERNGNHKLKERDVLQIKQLLEDGYTQADVARKFGVQAPAIYKIVHGLHWAEVYNG